jgi:hypothetical protein
VQPKVRERKNNSEFTFLMLVQPPDGERIIQCIYIHIYIYILIIHFKFFLNNYGTNKRSLLYIIYVKTAKNVFTKTGPRWILFRTFLVSYTIGTCTSSSFVQLLHLLKYIQTRFQQSSSQGRFNVKI